MLLPEDYVLWDNELSNENKKEVGDELSALGELSKDFETLPHIVITRNAFSHFLEQNDLKIKVGHLLGTLNHSRHDSVAQISSHIKSIFKKSEISSKIHSLLHGKIEKLPAEKFVVRAYYFDSAKLLRVQEEAGIAGDAVIMDKVRELWADLYSSENIAKFYIHSDNHHNLSVVVAVIPMLEYALSGYTKHAGRNEYEIEAHSMTRYHYNKASKRIEKAVVLPGGDKDALSPKEIKELLDIASYADKKFYIPHTVYWGKYKDLILLTRVLPGTSSEHKDSFNSLVDALTVHPGITVGRLRVVNERNREILEFDNEIIMVKSLDTNMAKALKNVKGIILKEDPHPEVKILLQKKGVPTVVRYDNKILYSTGDVVSLNATTGEIKRGSMLVS